LQPQAKGRRLSNENKEGISKKMNNKSATFDLADEQQLGYTGATHRHGYIYNVIISSFTPINPNTFRGQNRPDAAGRFSWS
jgi:hypothetical protein